MLLEKKYCFHIDDTPQYPIYQYFSGWPFPREMVNADTTIRVGEAEPTAAVNRLRESVVSDVIKARDECCLVSHWKGGVPKSHLVPKAEEQWVSDCHLSC